MESGIGGAVEGGDCVKLRLNSLEEVERWILGFGEHAMVLEPEALRERVRTAAERVTAKYVACG